MPKVFLPVPEVDKSITRPVVLDIVRQVMDITNISKDTNILFLGDAKSTRQAGSDVGADQLNNTKISASEQIAIEVAESYNNDYLGTMAIAQTEQIPIFIDNDLGVVLKPIYGSHVFEISFRYRSPSRTKAKAWRDEIYMRVNQMRDVNLHSATYHYSIPTGLFGILKEIHRLRENVAGYNQDFDTYFHENMTTRVTEATTLNGSSTQFVIAEKQMRIQGLFGFTESPEKANMGGETDMWITEFTYKVTFDIPLGVHMVYPIMIHNQLLDDRYIAPTSEDDEKHDKAFSHSLKALHFFEVPQDIKRHQAFAAAVQIPENDDWLPDNAPPQMHGIIHALCQVDTSDDKYLLNLRELGDYSIDEDILEYFAKEEYKYLTLPYKSIYHISMYRFRFLTTDRNLSVDKDLKVMTKESLPLRANHRVRLSMVTDITSVDPACFKRMKKYPEVLRKTLTALRISYDQLMEYAPVVNMLKYMPHLTPTGLTLQAVYAKRTNFNTVNSAYVVARDGKFGDKLEDYKAAPYTYRDLEYTRNRRF